MHAPGQERLEISPIPPHEGYLAGQVQQVAGSSKYERDDTVVHRANQSLTGLPTSQPIVPGRIDEVSHSRNEWEETMGESQQFIAASHSVKQKPAHPMHGLKNVTMTGTAKVKSNLRSSQEKKTNSSNPYSAED